MLSLGLVRADEKGAFPKWFAAWRGLCFGLKTLSVRKGRVAYYVWSAPLLSLMGDR